MNDLPGHPRETTLTSMAGDVASDVARLLRQEVNLARAEIQAEGKKVASAGRLIISGAVAMFFVAVLVSVAAVFAVAVVLSERVPELASQAYAISAGGLALLWLIIGAILLARGRRRLRSFSPIPRRTIKTLKEDIAWLKKLTA